MGETTTNAVVRYKPMIRMIAAKLAKKLPPGILIDDLMQEGMIALIGAVRQSKNDHERFSTYAYQRIQGAMLDSLRSLDNAPVGLRRQSRQANAVVASLEQKLGRRPFESEIATAMGIELNEYQRLLFDVYSSNLLYFDPTDNHYSDVFSVIDAGNNPEEQSGRQQLIAAIDWAIDALPDQLGRVVAAIYMHGHSARDVACDLSLSEGRISQLRKESLERIRKDLHRRGMIPE